MKKVSVKTKFKVNDNILVVSGSDKGKRGKLLFIDRKNHRVVVEGINKKKKHMKPSQENPKGGIINIERPINISNVMYFCDKCKKGIRIAIDVSGDNKIRKCNKCGKGLA